MGRQRTYFRHPDSGDHVIATEAYGFYLMETDFRLDWTTSPFRRDRCLVVVAVERGFGTVNMDGIDFVADGRSAPVADSILTRGTASRANQATTLYGRPASHLLSG